MFLGIDDTDSPGGMCTTYLGALISRRLKSEGYEIFRMRLIRLNPNVIWKTRGNAGVCIETDAPADYLFGLACDYVEKYAQFDCENTNPGVVVLEKRPKPDFYYKALRNFCEIEEAEEELKKAGALYKGYKNKRGLIGAYASVCAELFDKTYECLSYRRPENFGKLRCYEPESFFRSQKETEPNTWDTVDFKSGDVVCFSHGKDPVLYGIRGSSPEYVLKAVSCLKSEEPDFSIVWETNQGTDAHIVFSDELYEGGSFSFSGTVESDAQTIRGGHVSVMISGVRCFAFEPTKYFRDYVRALRCGDKATVFGSYHNGVLNLEKFHLDYVSKAELRRSPRCPVCGGRMTSAGKNKGYKCRVCSARVRETEYEERDIEIGWYEVPADSRRHLAKPVCRILSGNDIS